MTRLDVLQETMKVKGCEPGWSTENGVLVGPWCSQLCPSYTDALCVLTDDDSEECHPMIEAMAQALSETSST